MEHRVEITFNLIEHNILEVTLKGVFIQKYSQKDIVEFRDKIVSSNSKRILVNYLECKFMPDLVTAYNRKNIFSDIDMEGVKIAGLYKHDEYDPEFVTRIYQNSGYDVQHFYNRQEALNWLKS